MMSGPSLPIRRRGTTANTAGWSTLLEPLGARRLRQLAIHLVANGVRGDSRVLKSAQVTQSLGLPTLLVGITPATTMESFELEGVPVLLVPFRGVQASDDAVGLSPFDEEWPKAEAAVRKLRAIRSLRSGALQDVTPREKLARSGQEPAWASHQPTTSQIVRAFLELLRCTRPRLIHCHDLVPLPAAVAHASQERLRGRRTWTIYDAHESATSLIEYKPDIPSYKTMLAIEQEFIRDVNDVLTVSDEIAELLHQTYKLRNRPIAVLNAPSAVRSITGPTLREVIGLPDSTPLAVYSGWIDPVRRVDSTVRALSSIPSLHLAIVCSKINQTASQVWRLAIELGVEDRVHFAEYVSPDRITHYLSSADIGIIPHAKGPHLDLSLPTKWREYLHAGLPMAVSQNRAMERETNRLGVGLVFNPYSIQGQVQQIQRVLAERDQFASRITAAALREHSWERQADILGKRYLHGLKHVSDSGRTELAALSSALRSLEGHADLPDDEIRGPRRIDVRRQTVNIGIGPANNAGQAREWAEILRRAGLTAESFGPKTLLCDPPHRVVRPERSRGLVADAAELGLAVSQYTHLLVDGLRPIAGSLLPDLGAELEVLKRHIPTVGLIAHGSDIRDPDRHMARLDASYFHTAPASWTELLRGISAENHRIVRAADCPVFVTTPDLLVDLEWATWLPLVVNLATWEAVRDRPRGQRLRFLHRPSRSDPPIKGSDVIIPVLDQLEQEGVIDVVRADVTAHGDMPALLAEADVVVDQIRTGSYGVAAVEAMAARRIVIGHVAPDVRDLVDDEIPIIDAPPTSFERTVRDLAAASSDALDEIAMRGEAYARRWHDGRKSLAVLEAFVDRVPAPQLIAT